ncbi:MAG TPA: NAD(P)-dependent oxidoreductase [Polyangiaceae bacterium]|nr:NAD(P)-dependent oxidoreductase [Polyangiaceae bacterium]
MKVLVTGAMGRLGSVVRKELLRRGHAVVATDLRAASSEAEVEPGVPFELVDLRDSAAVYPLLRGQDAVVHLANIPSLRVGVSPQVVLSENVAMNANVFQAARELGVPRIVFASSLQAMIRLDDGRPTAPPYTIPYFPLDGDAPTNPGRNYYGLSKEFGERMLRLLSEQEPERRCTSLRFPMLAGDWLRERVQQPLPLSGLNFGEALTYLELPDAAVLVALVLERQAPGYHQYFPAQALQLEGLSPAATVARFYPDSPARCPGEPIRALVDRTALERDFGFFPQPPLTVRLTGN